VVEAEHELDGKLMYCANLYKEFSMSTTCMGLLQAESSSSSGSGSGSSSSSRQLAWDYCKPRSP